MAWNRWRPVYAGLVYPSGDVERWAGIKTLSPGNERDLCAGLLAEAVERGAALLLDWNDRPEWPSVLLQRAK